MVDRGSDLIPTSILTLILEKMKETSDESVQASKEMVKAINDVATAITYPPTRKDLSVQVQTAIDLSVQNNRIMSDLKKLIEEGEDEVVTIRKSVDSLKNTVKIWIGVITVIITLAGIIYTTTQHSLDLQIQKSIQKAVETIITSRPGNELPGR